MMPKANPLTTFSLARNWSHNPVFQSQARLPPHSKYPLFLGYHVDPLLGIYLEKLIGFPKNSLEKVGNLE